MMFASVVVVVLLLPMVSSASSDSCVCYTRNMVESASALRRAVLSAYSLRSVSPDTKSWLATDYDVGGGAAEALLPLAMRATLNRPLFDGVSVLNESYVDVATDLVGLLSRHPESRPARIARSRIGRLRLLADPPCSVTLFLDDDTYFCEAPPDLTRLFSTSNSPDVRAFMFFKTDQEHKVDAGARACERLRGGGRDDDEFCLCYDRAGSFIPKNVCAGAQGGAVAVSRSPRASRFARDWLEIYVRGRFDSLGGAPTKLEQETMIGRMNWLDQSALRSLSLEKCASAKARREEDDDWTLGHLPYVMNYRAVKKYSFVGKVRLVHQKALFPPTGNTSTRLDDHAAHMDAVCRRLNAFFTTERHLTMYEELRDLSFAPRDAQPPSIAKKHHHMRRSQSSSPRLEAPADRRSRSSSSDVRSMKRKKL